MLAQEAAGETMLLDLDGGTYFALNEVGARVWDLCDGNTSVADIARVLAAEYEAPEAVIMRDVIDLLTELRAERLVAVD
ncbi:MAG: PqqD family protein [Actinomycetota bacterium]|nr:PqqD family protein [Actinomycetota bacterium]